MSRANHFIEWYSLLNCSRPVFWGLLCGIFLSDAWRGVLA